MLCHYTFHGSDPTTGGLWEVDKANPVVIPGQLWSQICKGGVGAGKACDDASDGGHGTHDEGTSSRRKGGSGSPLQRVFVDLSGLSWTLIEGAGIPARPRRGRGDGNAARARRHGGKRKGLPFRWSPYEN